VTPVNLFFQKFPFWEKVQEETTQTRLQQEERTLRNHCTGILGFETTVLITLLQVKQLGKGKNNTQADSQ
jgi:hypothetical protein